MAASTMNEIKRWLERGKEEKATHMIVVVDTWDHEDFPVFISKEGNVKDKISYYENKKGYRIMEVYRLDMSIEEQLKEHRAYNI